MSAAFISVSTVLDDISRIFKLLFVVGFKNADEFVCEWLNFGCGGGGGGAKFPAGGIGGGGGIENPSSLDSEEVIPETKHMSLKN